MENKFLSKKMMKSALIVEIRNRVITEIARKENIMNNKFTYTFLGNQYVLEIYKTSYINNGNLAISAVISETQESFDILTVNVDDLPYGMACLDTNNLPGIYEALMEAGLIYETGFTMKSGFNTYPVALFNVDELPELEVQN